MEFDGASAVITGAGNGIGRSIALELGSVGTQVLIADLDGDAADAVAKEITDAGGTARARKLDVTDYAAVEALADEAFSEFGRVDILHNNAGVTWRPFRAVWNATLADFRWMTEVNYFGVVNGIVAFLPRMRAQEGRKQILNTSSMATISQTPGHGLYTAAKHAVDGLSDTLREELIDQGDDFGVTVLYPGQITTGIGERSREIRKLETGEDQSHGIAYVQVREAAWAHNEPKTPENVGKQVVEAIRHNDPYCLTHTAPIDYLEDRNQLWVQGYRGY
jgi:NAD(P)-dependent dehydrogenase (short-subunit alcohol dehydrogenase family)